MAATVPPPFTLRGLPASNTLILINGRRVANDGLSGESVDLNSISPAAVERVEILKDSASAIYGSDAIAGVINVIMKREFHGVLAETYYGESSRGDLTTTTQTLQYGTSFRDGGLFLSASHYEQEPLFSRDREVSRSADTRFLGGTDQRSSATADARVVPARRPEPDRRERRRLSAGWPRRSVRLPGLHHRRGAAAAQQCLCQHQPVISTPRSRPPSKPATCRPTPVRPWPPPRYSPASNRSR